MGYRDDTEALKARRDALRGARRAGEDVAEELAAVDARVEKARSLALRVLEDVRVATPCPASWAGMVGDDRVRHCALCEKNVYDVSGLTALEAARLVVEREGDLCMRLHRRRDGTLITADCDVGRRRRWRRGLGAAGAVAAGAALAVAAGTSANAVAAAAPALPAPQVPPISRTAGAITVARPRTPEARETHAAREREFERLLRRLAAPEHGDLGNQTPQRTTVDIPADCPPNAICTTYPAHPPGWERLEGALSEREED